MSRQRQGGFSLIEVLVAIVILSIGMLMLAGGSLYVTRDLVRSRQATRATSLAQAKLDELRTRAAATSPSCTSGLFTSSVSATTWNGVSLTWSVPNSGSNRNVLVVTSYNLGRGRTKRDTLSGNVAC